MEQQRFPSELSRNASLQWYDQLEFTIAMFIFYGIQNSDRGATSFLPWAFGVNCTTGLSKHTTYIFVLASLIVVASYNYILYFISNNLYLDPFLWAFIYIY